MKLPRRAPREVYRVYDEDEFIAAAGSELAAASSGMARSIGLLGLAALLVGAVGVFGGLFTSGRRLQRGESTVDRRGSRTANAVSALVVKVPDASPRIRRAARAVPASRKVARRRLAPAPSRLRLGLYRPDPPRAVDETHRALPVTAPDVGYARPAEFSFER